MKHGGPVVAGLCIATLCLATDARAAACTQSRTARAATRPDSTADDQYNLISGLFERGFHDRVVPEARRFLEDHGAHRRAPLVRYRLGQSLFELKKYAEAREELAALEPSPPDFPWAVEVSFRLGQCALELGDPAGAARRFDSIVASSVDHYLHPAAAFFSGEAHFRAEAFASAAKSYAKVVQRGDSEYARGALHGLGWSLYRAGELEMAADSLELFVQRHPQDPAAPEALFLLGECRLGLHEPAEALVVFQRVPKGEWFDDALSAAGFACAELGEDSQAAQWFLRLEQSMPESPLVAEARLHAGLHLQRAGKQAQAAAVLDRLLGGDAGPFAAEACYWRGVVERAAAGPKPAIAWFERGIAAKPEGELSTRLQLARADALFDAEEFDAAKEAYARVAGESEDAAYSSAVAALNGGDFGGAEMLTRTLLSRWPAGRHAAAAQLVRGESLFAQRKWAEALPAFEAAAGAKQDAGTATRPRALSRAGWCCFELKRFPEAAAHFGAVASEFPGDERAAEASFMAGHSLWSGGDARAAEEALARHLDAHATSEWSDDARYDLAQAKRALGKVEESEKLLAGLARGGARTDAGLARRAALETAEARAAAGRHAEALSALQPLLAPEVPLEVRRPALYAQAWSLAELERNDEAWTALAALFATDAPDARLPAEQASPALELAVTVARARGDGEGARAAYLRLAEADPRGERASEAALVAALALDEGGDARGAAALLEGAIAKWPKFAGLDRLIYQRARSLEAAGEEGPAAALLAQLAREHPKSPLSAPAAFDLGERAYDAGDWDAALAHYARALGADSPIADAALYKTGWCRFQKQEFERAAQEFDAVAARHADSPLAGESLYLAGEALVRAGDREAALVRLTAFLERHPRHEHRANALFRSGVAHGELGRFGACRDALERLLRDFPDHEMRAESHLWLGKALLAEGSAGDALEQFDAVLRLERGALAARAHLGRGDALLAQGRLDDALGEFLKVSLLFQGEAEVARALLRAGECLEQLGDREKAKARYRELLEQHPGSADAPAARTRLKELESMRGS